jgi:hypothetical protein
MTLRKVFFQTGNNEAGVSARLAQTGQCDTHRHGLAQNLDQHHDPTLAIGHLVDAFDAGKRRFRQGITAGKLAGWIEERGGVQEVKLSRSATYVSPKAKAAQAKSTLSALPNLAVAKDKLAELADADFVGNECVLLAEQQADGSFHIKALTRSGTAVKAALTALYSEQQKAAA